MEYLYHGIYDGKAYYGMIDEKGDSILEVEGSDWTNLSGFQISRVFSINKTENSEILLAARNKSECYSSELNCRGGYLVKLKRDGSLNWWKKYESEYYADGLYYAEEYTNGNIIACGIKGKKLWILQTDFKGNEITSITFDEGSLNKIHHTSDGNFIAVGESDGMGVVYKLPDPITDIKINADLFKDYNLFQNYPNPFNPTTKIKYTIPVETFRGTSVKVTLKVYNVLGKEVATLVNKEQSAGSYEVEFKVEGLSSGVYFYKLHTGSFAKTKKMLLLR